MEQQQCAACAEEERGRKYPKRVRDLGGLVGGFLLFAVLAAVLAESQRYALHAVSSNAIFLFAAMLAAMFMFIAMIACLGFAIPLAYDSIALLLRNGIGQRVYRFRDRAGREHAHVESKRFSTTDWQLVDDPILMLRRGGWFRTCAVIADRQVASRWRVWSWNGDDVRTTDAKGCAIGPLPISEAFDIMRTARTMQEWMNHKRAAEAAREILGSGLAEMEHVLQRAPKTIGRTKHAKVLLHCISRIFEQFTPFRDTGMRPPSTAADVESADGMPSALRIADWAIAAARIDDAALIREALGEDPQPEPRPDHPAQETA